MRFRRPTGPRVRGTRTRGTFGRVRGTKNEDGSKAVFYFELISQEGDIDPWEFLEYEFEERRTRTRGTRWNQYRSYNIETKKTQTPDSQSELLKEEFEERGREELLLGLLLKIQSWNDCSVSTEGINIQSWKYDWALAFYSCIHKFEFIATLGSSFVILTHYPSFS